MIVRFVDIVKIVDHHCVTGAFVCVSFHNVYSKYISGSSGFPPISPQKLSETPFEKAQELPKTLRSRQFLFTYNTLAVERSSTGSL